jgi:hypothetical protein
MRTMLLGLLAAIAVMGASTVPASACGGCWGCDYASPCAPAYVQPHNGCANACGAAFERLPDPEVQYHSAPVAPRQYYYVNQGPTYTGPAAFAPYRFYDEGAVATYHHRHHRYRPVLHSYY